MLYQLRGFDFQLVEFVVATAFTIDTVTKKEEKLNITGTITFRDYVSKMEWWWPWEVQNTGENVEIKTEQKPFKSGNTCEPMPARAPTKWLQKLLLTELRHNASSFICGQIQHFLKTKEERILEPTLYRGPVGKLNACLCGGEDPKEDPMIQNDLDRLLDEKEILPPNCVFCACGRHWWRNPEGLWYLVLDKEAWEMLIRHNGNDAKLVFCLDGRLYLPANVLSSGILRATGIYPKDVIPTYRRWETWQKKPRRKTIH